MGGFHNHSSDHRKYEQVVKEIKNEGFKRFVQCQILEVPLVDLMRFNEAIVSEYVVSIIFPVMIGFNTELVVRCERGSDRTHTFCTDSS